PGNSVRGRKAGSACGAFFALIAYQDAVNAGTEHPRGAVLGDVRVEGITEGGGHAPPLVERNRRRSGRTDRGSRRITDASALAGATPPFSAGVAFRWVLASVAATSAHSFCHATRSA